MLAFFWDKVRSHLEEESRLFNGRTGGSFYVLKSLDRNLRSQKSLFLPIVQPLVELPISVEKAGADDPAPSFEFHVFVKDHEIRQSGA